MEPMTAIMNGVTDNRFFKEQKRDQYDQDAANMNELIKSMEDKTCLFRNTDLKARMGASGGYFNGTVKSQISQFLQMYFPKHRGTEGF